MTEATHWKRHGSLVVAGAAVTGVAVAARKLMSKRSEADLTGEVALITGGTRGLGYLVARELGQEGCRLAICARDEDELAEAEQEFRELGHEILALKCDVSDPDQVSSMIRQINDHYGRIDVLINNAGIIQFGPARSMDRSDFEDAMSNMFWGTVYPTLEVIPQMTERGSGRIVNITSVGGKVSVPHLLPYSSAKFAATGFSEGLRTEVAKDGISVTTIVPGLMRTGSYYNAQFKGQTEKEYAWFSLGSSLPLITINAERAARQIVQATKRGEAERILSIPANVLARVNGLFPGVTSNFMSLADRFLLPDPNAVQEHAESGRDVDDRLDSVALQTATTLGRNAAQEYQPRQNLSDEARREAES